MHVLTAIRAVRIVVIDDVIHQAGEKLLGVDQVPAVFIREETKVISSWPKIS